MHQTSPTIHQDRGGVDLGPLSNLEPQTAATININITVHFGKKNSTLEVEQLLRLLGVVFNGKYAELIG